MMSSMIRNIENLMGTRGMLSDLTDVVKPIVVDLSNRDPRFVFIKKSLNEFLYGDQGLYVDEWQFEALQTGMSAPLKFNDTGTNQANRKFDLIYLHLPMNFIDIVNSTIYELSDIFNVHISPSQALESNRYPVDRVKLLENLYQQSKDLKPEQAKTRLPEPAAAGPQEGSEYLTIRV
ncbi:hypothetical protein F5Y08DRAFT_142948 [Xylaria arbuscula]|nr:hypothetical protein F5Y08DRAFT_142948 [Xylaria arbuscula]